MAALRILTGLLDRTSSELIERQERCYLLVRTPRQRENRSSTVRKEHIPRTKVARDEHIRISLETNPYVNVDVDGGADFACE